MESISARLFSNLLAESISVHLFSNLQAESAPVHPVGCLLPEQIESRNRHSVHLFSNSQAEPTPEVRSNRQWPEATNPKQRMAEAWNSKKRLLTIME